MAAVPTGEEGAGTVCAVVVTHNRPALLERCLDHLGAQSRRPNAILVVDNASTDETPNLLAGRDGVRVLTLESNTGGSGGFRAGVERAYEEGFDWLWLLDDDTLVEPDCLAALLTGAARAPERPSVVSSVVHWRDGRLHPMNRPWLRLSRRGSFAVAAGAGLAEIRAATFVSAMVHREAIDQHGLPHGHYFIWLDDIEFTARVLRNGAGFLVPESVAVHWTPEPYNTITDTRDRFYYKARNHLWLLRGDSFGGMERAVYASAYVRALAKYLRHSPDRRRAFTTAFRGVRDGLRPEPVSERHPRVVSPAARRAPPGAEVVSPGSRGDAAEGDR